MYDYVDEVGGGSSDSFNALRKPHNAFFSCTRYLHFAQALYTNHR